jgi:cytochrome c
MKRAVLMLALPFALAACGGNDEPAPDAATETVATTDTAPVAASGADLYKQCVACHTIDKGGRNAVGPNLHNIVGRAVASAEGYNYSVALKAKGGNWDEAGLDAYIADPRAAVPGNKMAFAGVKDAAKRKALVDYLKAQK